MTVRARAPCRIDLSGGTLDLWPLYLLIEQAATVNLAIDLYTEAVITESEDSRFHVRERDSGRELASGTFEDLVEVPGAEICGRLLGFFKPASPLTVSIHSQAPPQAGLGASSSLGISIAGALNAVAGFRYRASDLVSIVRDVEVEVLGTMTGAQDHYPPVYGGAMCLWWEKLRHRREPLELDRNAFERRFSLAYSHQPHRSGATNWEVVRRFLDGDQETRSAVAESGKTAVAVRDALVRGDLDGVAGLIGKDWECRRRMAPAVSSPELEKIIHTAHEAGSTGVKVCGAGGGGCMIVAAPEELRSKVSEAISRAGGSVIDYHLVERGLTLV
ncbi:MAG TPA: hypothetical protein VEK15_20680 [Vicinamibacteria bacterium]|nr:hypothetical protein [Vicinamibacteria bacterium]